ncbi:LysR family transcriptional regulator [Paenibacillus radicis (ex Xue et al. 2023)]|uniref:LysR family transcriptional regulator n=1 Tax=Paenibacillus radicis (ex Xue et al. 2023) TaxID=2972489 RepID=A0ABT1YG87_9BACL|nr:LysR family transcriptional regulator [Paenibacillus radicis (ex Xue et al. 2023)]MCR8630975.1 LysR family transcriptional regulator [Paenibacillus radicis (ex Xue et al. 2023)]
MEIRHLKYITEIMRHNSFTKAAEALHITQPTISKMIKNLENELNIEVFARDGKQIKLTNAGEAIVKHAGPILQLFDGMMTEINDLTYLHKGSIRIGLPPMAGSRFFPEVLKRFQEQYPGISIKMVEDGARKIEESLSDGTLDVGVVLGPVDEEMFDTFRLVEDRLKVIMHPAHKLAQRSQIELVDLAHERFILFSSDFALHDRIINECRAIGYDPHIVYESSQWDFIGEMVGADLGIAMLPDTICRVLDPDKLRAVSLVNPIIPWELVMAWRKEGYLSLAAREWIAFTKKIFNERV